MKKKIKDTDETSISFSGDADQVSDMIEDYYDGIVFRKVLWEVDRILRSHVKYGQDLEQVECDGEEFVLCKKTLQYVRGLMGKEEALERDKIHARFEHKLETL